jgi:hypothetical protein
MCTMPLGLHLPGKRFVEHSVPMQALILMASWCASVAVSLLLVHLIYGRHRPNRPDSQPSQRAETNLSPEIGSHTVTETERAVGALSRHDRE